MEPVLPDGEQEKEYTGVPPFAETETLPLLPPWQLTLPVVKLKDKGSGDVTEKTADVIQLFASLT